MPEFKKGGGDSLHPPFFKPLLPKIGTNRSAESYITEGASNSMYGSGIYGEAEYSPEILNFTANELLNVYEFFHIQTTSIIGTIPHEDSTPIELILRPFLPHLVKAPRVELRRFVRTEPHLRRLPLRTEITAIPNTPFLRKQGRLNVR